MRLAVFTLSAVLLSGCSWLGGAGSVFNGGGQGHHAQNAGQYEQGGRYNARSQHGQHQYRAQHDPCQIYSPQAPIPQGCNPAQVTLGTAGGFPQQPNFGGGQYASQGYGSHAGVAGQQSAHYNPRKSKLRKPRFRGSMSLGVEKSNSGNLLDYAKNPMIDPVGNYNPQLYREGFDTGTEASGSVTSTTYTANDRDAGDIRREPSVEDLLAVPPVDFYRGFESSSRPDISFDDVYSTPARIAVGGEYILTPRTTLFANAGFSKAEGNSGQVASVQATLYREVSEQPYQDDPANPGTIITNGPPLINTTFIPNREIARFSYDFTDMNRVDLEAGARHYLSPLMKSQGFKTLTPFVGASVGASHYNSVSFDVTQEQAFYQRAFDSASGVTEDYYTVTGPTNRVELYDSQWVPSGQLNAGMEWQVTPKTALAFETGVRIEGARKYSNEERGDKNVSIPMTIRGSYNF